MPTAARFGQGLEALNGICPYYTMFPLSFPLRQLKNARRGDWVIDPFCGRGSTNYAARLYGLPSMGVDVNPVAAAIAQAKGVSATPQEVISVCERILVSGEEPKSVPEGQFWGDTGRLVSP